MSIDPVLAIAAVPTASTRSDFPARSGQKLQVNSAHPDLKIRANRELEVPPKEAKSFELPQDVVQVQRESQHQIVIKYLDDAGKVIFQLPSSQVLALQRAIEKALENQARSRDSNNAAAVGGSQGVRHEY